MESLDLEASAKSEEGSMSCSSSLIANFRLDDDYDGETRDLFILVDDPEKHTSTLEAYITFRITTKVRELWLFLIRLHHFRNNSNVREFWLYLIRNSIDKYNMSVLDYWSVISTCATSFIPLVNTIRQNNERQTHIWRHNTLENSYILLLLL